MDYEDALKCLARHANLSDDETDEHTSFVFAVWNFDRNHTAPNFPAPDFPALYRQVLACLEVVNHYLNGNTPSETFDKRDELNGTLVQCVSTILEAGCRYGHTWSTCPTFKEGVCHELSLVTWKISFAWLGVISGDIDDLTEYVENRG
jgi:hypothetical protein